MTYPCERQSPVFRHRREAQFFIARGTRPIGSSPPSALTRANVKQTVSWRLWIKQTPDGPGYDSSCRLRHQARLEDETGSPVTTRHHLLGRIAGGEGVGGLPGGRIIQPSAHTRDSIRSNVIQNSRVIPYGWPGVIQPGSPVHAAQNRRGWTLEGRTGKQGPHVRQALPILAGSPVTILVMTSLSVSISTGLTR